MNDPLDTLYPDNDKSKRITPRTLKGSKPMSKKALLTAVVAGFICSYAFNALTHTEEEWTKYLPTGQMTLAKAKMRICQDKAVCPNGYKDAASIKVYYPSAPEPAPASYIPPTELPKMSEVPSLESSVNGPLAALPLNNTGKQLISMLGNTIQKTQR
jgi:hypothetical protein